MQVLAQGRQPLTADESRALGLGGRTVGYAREVVLRVDDHAMVFARSVTAHAASVGAWRSVRGLGSRPLADVLFKRSGIARAPLAYSQLKRQSPLQRHVATRGLRRRVQVWASRGLAGAPLGIHPPWRQRCW